MHFILIKNIIIFLQVLSNYKMMIEIIFIRTIYFFVIKNQSRIYTFSKIVS